MISPDPRVDQPGTSSFFLFSVVIRRKEEVGQRRKSGEIEDSFRV